MIHAFPFSHAFSFSCFTFVCLFSSLRLTWLADPALVTSVYPNQMQYTPRVLQEVSLLDGVDAGVRGNGRRFSKTSSYPPCRCYAFILFHPYFLMTHYTTPHLTNRSHTPYRLCSPIDSFILLDAGTFPTYGRTMYLRICHGHFPT